MKYIRGHQREREKLERVHWWSVHIETNEYTDKGVNMEVKDSEEKSGARFGRRVEEGEGRVDK